MEKILKDGHIYQDVLNGLEYLAVEAKDELKWMLILIYGDEQDPLGIKRISQAFYMAVQTTDDKWHFCSGDPSTTLPAVCYPADVDLGKFEFTGRVSADHQNKLDFLEIMKDMEW